MDYTPQRVASLQPSATITLAAIGKLDRLVACTKYCYEVCPEVVASGCPIIEDSWTADAQQIIAASPDFIIGSVPYQEKSVIEILKTGIPFLGLAPKTLTNIYRDIAAIAGVMGVPERGTRVIEQMQLEIETVRKRAADLPRPRVFCEEWGKPVIASQPWVAELVDAAGGQFVCAPGARVIENEVITAEPEIWIAAWCGAGDRVPLRKIIRDRGWSDIPAVRSDRVYCIRDEFLNTPAPTLVHGLHALANAIHPERFPQVAGLRCVTAEPESVSPVVHAG